MTPASSPLQYVLGFAFNPTYDYVVLIEKARPVWQAGLLNGVGGKIELFDESVQAAMQREFLEETGITTSIEQWMPFTSHVKIGDGAYTMHVLHATLTEDQETVLVGSNGEQPVWLALDTLIVKEHGHVPGLSMYISMALNHLNRSFTSVTIESPKEL